LLPALPLHLDQLLGDVAAPVPPPLPVREFPDDAFGRFGGAVRPDFHNPFGLKTRDASGATARRTTSGSPTGGRVSPRTSTTWPCMPGPRGTRDRTPRIRGTSPGSGARRQRFEALAGAWAPSADYGRSIVRDYLRSLLATEAPGRRPLCF